MAGLGMWILGLCIQYVGTEPLTCKNDEQTGLVSWEDV